MDQENNIDELDKMLFDYFDSNKNVPNYINETIHNTLQKEKKQRNSFNIMKKVAMIIISFGIISTSIVFADDIINFITSMFINSTEAIDSAVENGYVQNVNMDYIYDNDIGVKVDALLLDDTNLDISFAYNYQGKEQIDSLQLYEYTIKDEYDNILYEFNNELKTDFVYPIYVSRYNETVLIENNIYKDSIIYTSTSFPNTRILKLDIKSFKCISNGTYNTVNGNWNIVVNLNEKFIEEESDVYTFSYNENIQSCSSELTDTSLKINLKFNDLPDKRIIREKDSIILKDLSGKEYRYKILNLNNNEIYLEYDISKYMTNTNKLELIIKIYTNKEIRLKLEK